MRKNGRACRSERCLLNRLFIPQKARELHEDIPEVLAEKTSLYTEYEQKNGKFPISSLEEGVQKKPPVAIFLEKEISSDF